MREELRDASWATSSLASGRGGPFADGARIGAHKATFDRAVDRRRHRAMGETDGLRRSRLEGMAVSGSNEVPASEERRTVTADGSWMLWTAIGSVASGPPSS